VVAYSERRFYVEYAAASSIFLVLALVGAMQCGYYAPRLPEIVASHFGIGGTVNGWQTKTAFFAVEPAVILLATVISFGVPRADRSDAGFLDQPAHKEFWLGPENAKTRCRIFARGQRGSAAACWLFCFSLMELAYRANFSTPPQFNNAAFVPALLAFVIFDTGALGWLILHFSRTQVH